MSVEIYSKLYLALLRSLQKKSNTHAQIQRSENHKRIIQSESNFMRINIIFFIRYKCSLS